MSQTIITAGDASSGLVQAAGNDGTLVLQSGAAGAKVNAVSYASDGTPTFLKSGMVLSTAQNTTSGTSIDFTGIPSWVKRVTLMLNGVSTSGTSLPQLQLGSGSVDTSGYNSWVTYAGGSSNSTTGLLIGAGAAADLRYGSVVLTSMGSNIWTSSTNIGAASGAGFSGGGGKTLSGTLDRVRLTTIGGTDTFDAGSVNILYEG